VVYRLSHYYSYVYSQCGPVQQWIACLHRDESQPEMIADSSVEKPDGWLDDEPEFVPDPSSERPEDWYVMDGDTCKNVSHCLTIKWQSQSQWASF